MRSPQELAAEVAGRIEAYEDSADEVGDPRGQPIVETFGQLEELLVEAIQLDRAQRP